MLNIAFNGVFTKYPPRLLLRGNIIHRKGKYFQFLTSDENSGKMVLGAIVDTPLNCQAANCRSC